MISFDIFPGHLWRCSKGLGLQPKDLGSIPGHAIKGYFLLTNNFCVKEHYEGKTISWETVGTDHLVNVTDT